MSTYVHCVCTLYIVFVNDQLIVVSYRKPMLRELSRAKFIKAILQQHIVSRRVDSMTPGTEANEQTVEQLKQSMELLQPHVETLGMDILR